MDRAAAHGKPVLLLCEGVLMYFDASDVRAWLATLAQHLPQATLVFDIIPTILVGRAKRHDALGSMKKAPPEMKWSVKDSRELETWLPGLTLEEELLLSKTCGKRYPLFLQRLAQVFEQRVLCVPAETHGNVAVLAFQNQAPQPLAALQKKAAKLSEQYGLDFKTMLHQAHVPPGSTWQWLR